MLRATFVLGLMALFSGVLTSCNDGNSANPTATPTIIGKWDWVHSEGGLTGDPLTPAKLGYHQTYTFGQDGKYGLVRTPDTLGISRSGKYTVQRQFFPNVGDTTLTISFLLSDSQKPVTITEWLRMPSYDTILIGDNFADGTVETYVRKP